MRQIVDIKEFAEKVGEEVPDWSSDGAKLPVYMISINKLFYNDENGRIATWISSDLDLNPNLSYDDLSLIDFNNKIHDFIKKANSSDSFKKTYEDVKAKGQIRPGVILNDGRVVSGNRRFTVLRELYNDTALDKFSYFKCFIVDKNPQKEEDRKYIKTIEKLTQFGVDEKVDYDSIARLVDIYNDLIGPRRIWTKEEYAKKLSLKKTDVDLMYNKAKIMADFLMYINKPGKFYIARTMKLDGPLQELSKIYKNVSTDEWNRIRTLFYSKLSEQGDRSRDVRDIVKMYGENKRKFDELVSKCNEDIEKLENEKIYKININQNTNNIDIESNIAEIAKSEEIIAPVLSETTRKAIIDATYESGIEKKRQDKIRKVSCAIDELLLNIKDTYNIMNNNEWNIIEEKIIKLQNILKSLED